MKARWLFNVQKPRKKLAPSVIKIIKSYPHNSTEDTEISSPNSVNKRYYNEI